MFAIELFLASRLSVGARYFLYASYMFGVGGEFAYHDYAIEDVTSPGELGAVSKDYVDEIEVD